MTRFTLIGPITPSDTGETYWTAYDNARDVAVHTLHAATEDDARTAIAAMNAAPLVHFNFEDSMAQDEHGLYYVGPAVCKAIGAYATHTESDVTCPGCLDGLAILRDKGPDPLHIEDHYNGDEQ